MSRHAVLLLLLAAAACGSTTVNARLDGRFILEQEPSRGTFAATPLVKKADAQITALLGHPVVFAFDAAIIPKWQEAFETYSEAAIDGIAQKLARMKERDAAMFAWVAPRLRRIEWDYSATAQYASHEFDDGKGTLRIVLVSSNPRLVDEDEIGFAFGRPYGKTLASDFARVDPAAVPSGQLAGYSDWLLHWGYGYEHEARTPARGSDEETVEAPRARVAIKVLRLAGAIRGRDAELEKRLRAHIIEDAKWLAYTRRNHADAIARLGERSDFRIAESAFVQWLPANFDVLDERQKVTVAEEILHSTEEDGAVHAWLGLDVTALYLHVLDLWVTAGKPEKGELFEDVLGTVIIPASDDLGCRSQYSPVIRAMRRDESVRNRVFADALGRKDPAVIKLLMGNLLWLDGPPQPALAFWKATEGDDAAFHAATRVIAAHVDRCNHADEVYDQLPRLWKAYPRRHAVLAYLIHRYSSEGYRDNYARLFGALSRDDLAGVLDHEEADPLHELHSYWRDVAKDWARWDFLGPRLDGWITEDYKQRDMWWGISIQSIAQDLCAEKDKKSLAMLHAWIERRIQAKPSEIQKLKEASDRSEPTACPDK